MISKFIYYCNEKSELKNGWLIVLWVSLAFHLSPIYNLLSLFSSIETVVVNHNDRAFCGSQENGGICTIPSISLLEGREKVKCIMKCKDKFYTLKNGATYRAEVLHLGFGKPKVLDIYDSQWGM